MKRESCIYVAGGNSFIGAAIVNTLKRRGYLNILGVLNDDLDLRDRGCVDYFFAKRKPEYVFLVAGKSAGIAGNAKFPAELMLDNLLIECNIMDSAYRHGVKKFLYLASSCCYPKHCAQPMKESDLLTGALEPTNEPYAVAKIAGLKLAQSYRKQYNANFICGIPANVFGPGDDFRPEDSHVIAGLIRRMHEANINNLKKFVIWGTGKPKREFIYVDDLADACIFVMRNYDDIEPINLGSGETLSIKELALMLKKIIGFRKGLIFDSAKPDGMPAKVLNVHKLRKLGWRPHWVFRKALQKTYDWFVKEGIAG